MALIKTCAFCGNKIWETMRYQVNKGTPNEYFLHMQCFNQFTSVAGNQLPINKNDLLKIYHEKQAEDKEHRMRCNVCGHIFCYSSQDIMKNKELQRKAIQERQSAVMSALATSLIQSNQETASADKFESQIIDYSKCPKCNSSDLTELTEEEFKAAQKTMNQPSATAASSADEIKKFKELLDSGIITQEEFDAKKKQLLGL